MIAAAPISDSGELKHIIQRAQNGDQTAWSTLESRFKPRLLNLARLRISSKLKKRLCSDDVTQEAWLEAFQQLSYFLHQGNYSFYVWLRQITLNRIYKLYRTHVEAEKRTVNREVDLGAIHLNDSGCRFANHFAAGGSSPSSHLARLEEALIIRKAIGSLDPEHQEVILLRYFEGLTFNEIAEVEKISEPAVLKRHLGALKKLYTMLVILQGNSDRS